MMRIFSKIKIHFKNIMGAEEEAISFLLKDFALHTYILPKYYSKSGKRIIRQIFPSFRNEMSCIQIEAQLLVGGYDDDKD